MLSTNNHMHLISLTQKRSLEKESKVKRKTYNLWMRDTMVLNAAWMSAVVQVQTTGRWWF